MTWGEVAQMWSNALIAGWMRARRIVRCGRRGVDQGSDRAARQGTPHARRAHEAAMIVIEHAGYVLEWIREAWINDMPWSGRSHRHGYGSGKTMIGIDPSGQGVAVAHRPDGETPSTGSLPGKGIISDESRAIMRRLGINAEEAMRRAAEGAAAFRGVVGVPDWLALSESINEADRRHAERRFGLCPACGHNRHVHLGVGHPCGHTESVNGIIGPRCRCALAYVVNGHESYTTVDHDRTAEPVLPWRDMVATVDTPDEEDHSNAQGAALEIIEAYERHGYLTQREVIEGVYEFGAAERIEIHFEEDHATPPVDPDALSEHLIRMRRNDTQEHDLCAWCGHAGHEYGRVCPQTAAYRPGNLDGSPHMCGCVAWVGPEPEPVDGCPPPDRCAYCDHDDHDYGDGECHHMTRSSQWGTYRCACPGNRDSVTESPERPSNEIVVCSACGHPDHTMGGGRCAFLVPSRAHPQDSPDQLDTVCGCEAGTDRLFAAGQPVARRRVREHDPEYNDLQTYLEGGTDEAQAAARRLDQASVNTGQMSPKTFWDTWGELPAATFYSHKLWCARNKDHMYDQCPVWGAE